MRYKELLEKVKDLPKFPVYRNSSEVVNLGESLGIEDVVLAGVLAELNILLIGERGEGKTQIMDDVNNSLFGGRGTYIRARPDMRTKELYEFFNIKKLRRELADMVKAPLTMIDEINRAPPIIQNEFFHMCDGYIEHEGKKIQLGEGFHTTIASANVSSERYRGTFEMDDAILDRFYLILNIDNYPTKVTDDLEIITAEAGKSPKLAESLKEDHSEEIFAIAKEIKKTREEKFDFDAYLALLYLKRGLDYCSLKGSKRIISYAIPALCKKNSCDRLDKGCGYVRAISERTVEAIAALAPTLRLVADSKNGKGKGAITYGEILEAFRLASPYAGILDFNWVRHKYYSNPSLAVDELTKNIKEEFIEKKEEAKAGLRRALEGKLDNEVTSRFGEEWKFFSGALGEIGMVAKKHGKLIKNLRNENLIKQYPFLRALR